MSARLQWIKLKCLMAYLWVVHRTLKDAAKKTPRDRHKNARRSYDEWSRAVFQFVRGLPSIKPYEVSCKRLGEIVEGRIMKLPMRLNTDAAAIELLHCAHRLRHTTDSSVSSVYINAALSPAEVKQAFKPQRRRREQVSQRQGMLNSMQWCRSHARYSFNSAE